MLMKYHIGDFAEWIRIIRAQLVLVTSRLTALKLFPETVFSLDYNNNLKWAILEHIVPDFFPRKDFFIGFKH
jgi:hypothetical protein